MKEVLNIDFHSLTNFSNLFLFESPAQHHEQSVLRVLRIVDIILSLDL